MIENLFGNLVGLLSLATIVLVLIMAVYFIRMFKVWSDRDQALADAERNKKA